MNRFDPTTWKLPLVCSAESHRNLERLRCFAERFQLLRTDLAVELDENESRDDVQIEMRVRLGERVIATIAASNPDDDDFMLYPFEDEDGSVIATAEEAAIACAHFETEVASWSAPKPRKKRWQFWKKQE